MTSRLLITLAFGVVLPCVLLAQQGPAQPGGSDRATLAQRSPPEPTLKMYEDIEILRRLLEMNLRGIYGFPSFADAVARLHDGRVNINELFQGKTLNAPQYLEGVVVNNPNHNAIYTWLGRYAANADPHHGMLLPSMEGSYLPGHGVVYTMTLPPPSQPSQPETPKPSRKPLSDWERTRLELRGEKVPQDEPAESKPPSVSGTILKILAENGQHFGQLKDNENITVAVTFRSRWSQWDAQCAKCHVGPHGMSGAGGAGGGGMVGPGGGASGGLGSPGPVGGGAGSPPSAPPAYPVGPLGGGAGRLPGYPGGTSGAGGGSAGIGTGGGGGTIGQGGGDSASGGSTRGDAWAQIEDRILLGDLHAKQGRTKEAVGTYELAAAILEQYMNNTWQWDKEQIKAARELYAKMIQAHLTVGDNEAAKRVMARIDKIPAPRSPFTESAAQKPAPMKGAAQPQAALPGKMIVSATKRLLDQVGSGKLSFEDFKKQASVQYLTFGGAQKKAGELMSGPDKEVPEFTPKKP